MEAGKRLIVVVGGTGMFGGSVAHSLRDNPDFRIRLTTRDPAGPKARRRADEGFELVKANSWDASELEAAFQGAFGVFLNTDSDDPNLKMRLGPRSRLWGKSLSTLRFDKG